MILLGTLINGVAIIIGSLIGWLWTDISENAKTTIIQILGLAVAVLGLEMGMESQQFLIVISSLALGGLIGETLNLDGKFQQLGLWLERVVKAKEGSGIATAFISTTLIYIVGAMSIIGAMDSGIKQDHTLLITKSLLDGVSAIFYTATLGIGVIFSAIPVILYQGIIALVSSQIHQWVSPTLMDQIITEITGTGGLLIVAVGLSLLGLTKIRIANLLPSLPIVVILVLLLSRLQPYLPTL